MSATDQQEKEFFRRNFTIKGRVLYPNLLKPAADNRTGRLSFNCQFIWQDSDPANAQVMQEMQAFLAEAKQRYGAQIPDAHWVYPIKHYNTYQKQNGQPNPDYLKGHYWVNARSGADYAPSVFDAHYNRLMAGVHDADVYSGRNAVANISFYRIKKDKYGITTNINGVMLMDGGELVQGGGSFDPQAIFGQFASQMGINPQGGGVPPMGAPAAPMPPQGGTPPAPQGPQGWPQNPAQPATQPQQPSAPQGWPQNPAQPNYGGAAPMPPQGAPAAPAWPPQGSAPVPPQGNGYAPPAGQGMTPSTPQMSGGGYAPPASPSNHQTANYYGAPAWPPVNQ